MFGSGKIIDANVILNVSEPAIELGDRISSISWLSLNPYSVSYGAGFGYFIYLRDRE